MYELYNEDEGLSNIHDRGRSPRTCIFDDPESELYITGLWYKCICTIMRGRFL